MGEAAVDGKNASWDGSPRKEPEASNGRDHVGRRPVARSPEPLTITRSTAAAVAILLVALVVRLAVVIDQPNFEPVGDARAYDEHAVSISRDAQYPASRYPRGGGPTAFRPPAYPYLLASAYELTGTSDERSRYRVGRVLGAFLGVATVALIGALGMMLWGTLPALCAMAIAAVYPTLVGVSDSLLSEALFTPVVLASVACVVALRGSPHVLRWALAAGLLAGLAALTRTNGAVLLPLLVAGIWTLERRPRLVAAVGLLAGFALVLAPWLARNAAVFGEPVLSTQTGFTLAGTYNDASRNDPVNPAGWRATSEPPYRAALVPRHRDEAGVDSELRSLAVDYIRDHPSYVAEVALWNSLRMLEFVGWDRERLGAQETGVGPTFSAAARYAFWLVLVGAAAALFLAPASRRAPRFFYAVPLLLFASIVVTNSSARYREPVDPFLILLAGVGAAILIERQGWLRCARRSTRAA